MAVMMTKSLWETSEILRIRHGERSRTISNSSNSHFDFAQCDILDLKKNISEVSLITLSSDQSSNRAGQSVRFLYRFCTDYFGVIG